MSHADPVITFVSKVDGIEYVVDYTCSGSRLQILYVTKDTEDVTWTIDSLIMSQIDEDARDDHTDRQMLKAMQQNDER